MDLLGTLKTAMAYLSGVNNNQVFHGIDESDIRDVLDSLDEILKCVVRRILIWQKSKESD